MWMFYVLALVLPCLASDDEGRPNTTVVHMNMFPHEPAAEDPALPSVVLPAPLSLTGEATMNQLVDDAVRQYFSNGDYAKGSKALWKVMCDSKALLDQNAFVASYAFVYLVAMSGCKLDTAQKPGDAFRIKGPNYSANAEVETVLQSAEASLPYVLDAPTGLLGWVHQHASRVEDDEFTKAAKFAAFFVKLRNYPVSNNLAKDKKDAKQKIWDLADKDGFKPAQYYLGRQFEKLRYIAPAYYGWIFKCSRKTSCALYWYVRANGNVTGVTYHSDANDRIIELERQLKTAYMSNANHMVLWLTGATGTVAKVLSANCSADRCNEASNVMNYAIILIPAGWSALNIVTSSLADMIIGCMSLKKPDTKMFVH